MVNWTGGDKPPDKPFGIINTQKSTSNSWWTIWHTRAQVEAAIRAKEERRFQFTGQKRK